MVDANLWPTRVVHISLPFISYNMISLGVARKTSWETKGQIVAPGVGGGEEGSQSGRKLSPLDLPGWISSGIFRKTVCLY